MSACVSGTILRQVITEALVEAAEAGMNTETQASWVALRICGSTQVPLEHHFPSPGGGLCPTCGGSDFGLFE